MIIFQFDFIRIIPPQHYFFLSISNKKNFYENFDEKPLFETKWNNDFVLVLLMIITPHSFHIALVIVMLVCAIFWPLAIPHALAFFGDILPELLVYIADAFLIHNCILIKREWKDNPPDFIKKKQDEKERNRREAMHNRNMYQYKSYIEQSGIKFFIKYYEQIKCLPLRDITVTENYSSEEREERLRAAKKIIDSNLTELALR